MMIKRVISVLILMSAIGIVAQENSFSPYSGNGIGERNRSMTVEQSAMGGVGVATINYKNLNFVNPAALSGLKLTAYSFGGKITSQILTENDKSNKVNSSEISYIAVGFPLWENVGLSLGLQPNSSVSYSLLNSDSKNETKTRMTGDGGTNRFFAATGVNVYKGLSLGFEFSYVFGTVENTINLLQKESQFNTRYFASSHLKGSQIKFGALYKYNISDKLEFSSGLSIKLSNNLSSAGTERMYTYDLDRGYEFPNAVLYNRSIDRTINEPLLTTFGFGIGKPNQWFLGLQSEFSKAVDFAQDNIKSTNYLSSSLGGYFIPKLNSITSYWNRVTYRAGLRFERSGLLIRDVSNTGNFTALNDFGMNIGFSLPIPKHISTLDLGFEYGVKEAVGSLSKEQYYNVRVGFTFNSVWFKKRKID